MASKKAVLVYILEILKSETDANHTLSQEEIRSILAEWYEVSVDRKTLGPVSYTHLDVYKRQDDIWVILQGKGVFYPTPNTEVPFTKGQVIVSKMGECHGAKNTGTEDIVFVSIVAPVPADYDPVKTN